MPSYAGTCETCGRNVQRGYVGDDGLHKATVRNPGVWADDEDGFCNGVVLDGNGQPLTINGCLPCPACAERGKNPEPVEGSCRHCGHFGCPRRNKEGMP